MSASRTETAALTPSARTALATNRTKRRRCVESRVYRRRACCDSVFRLETSRLGLREMRPEDATALLVVFSDPRVMASFPGEALFDASRMSSWVGRNLEHQRVHGYGLFSVIHKGDGILIGDC